MYNSSSLTDEQRDQQRGVNILNTCRTTDLDFRVGVLLKTCLYKCLKGFVDQLNYTSNKSLF